jgi:hypothetical protein
MSLRLGDVLIFSGDNPGPINFHSSLGDSWGILVIQRILRRCTLQSGENCLIEGSLRKKKV